MVKVYDQIPEFKADDATVFQTQAWISAAWTHLLNDGKNRLWIAKWTEEKSDAFVLFPGYIDAKGCLRFINDTHSDIGGCVLTPSANVHYASKEIAAAIQEDKRIKSVWLQKMPGGSAALNALGVFLKGSVIYRDNAFSYVPVEQGDDFLITQAHLRSKDKIRFKGFAKKCQEYDFSILSANRGDVFPREEVTELRDELAKGRRGDASFFDDNLIAFVESVYNDGLCEIPILRKNGVVESLDFRLLGNGRIIAWVILSRNPNTVTLHYIRYAIEKSKVMPFVMDFGVGVYGWKVLTFRPRTALTFSLRYHKLFLGKFLDLIIANLRIGKDLIKSCMS